KAKEILNTEAGICYRKRSLVEVEPIFGNIKENHQFRRFMLREHEKVKIVFGLLAMAQNLRKKCRENARKAALKKAFSPAAHSVTLCVPYHFITRFIQHSFSLKSKGRLRFL